MAVKFTTVPLQYGLGEATMLTEAGLDAERVIDTSSKDGVQGAFVIVHLKTLVPDAILVTLVLY